MPHRPSWFTDDKVFISFADTCGINKDGNILFTVDPATGKRTERVDDKLIEDVDALLAGRAAATGRWVDKMDLTIGAPRYYDTRYSAEVDKFVKGPSMAGFTVKTLEQLVKEGSITRKQGHGSPSADRRGGHIPYIKVSDIRAGQVNINPSNLVPTVVAEQFWRGSSSGLQAFDLITPIRASKNIGEFAVLMPGQEQVVLTKEMLVLRATPKALVDNFYLLWALSLKVVREQWKRIVLMQTNREDVGTRYMEIEIPWPDTKQRGEEVSAAFRTYYAGVDALRRAFVAELEGGGDHHVFLGTAGEDSGAEDGDETGD